jgi:hypothetical protein
MQQKTESMAELINDAIELIKDRPKEALCMYSALKLDAEAQYAFLAAYRIVHEEEDEPA